MASAPLKRGPGRPMDVSKDVAIRRATWDILGTRGYDGLSFDAVAARAGCKRATIARRFSSKAELVKATLWNISLAVRAKPSPHDAPRDILIAYLLSDAGHLMSGNSARALMSIMERASYDPEVRNAVWSHLDADAEDLRIQFKRLYTGPHQDGVISFTIDSLYGSIIYQIAFRRKPLTRSQIEILVDRAISIMSPAICQRPSEVTTNPA